MTRLGAWRSHRFNPSCDSGIGTFIPPFPSPIEIPFQVEIPQEIEQGAWIHCSTPHSSRENPEVMSLPQVLEQCLHLCMEALFEWHQKFILHEASASSWRVCQISSNCSTTGRAISISMIMQTCLFPEFKPCLDGEKSASEHKHVADPHHHCWLRTPKSVFHGSGSIFKQGWASALLLQIQVGCLSAFCSKYLCFLSTIAFAPRNVSPRRQHNRTRQLQGRTGHLKHCSKALLI